MGASFHNFPIQVPGVSRLRTCTPFYRSIRHFRYHGPQNNPKEHEKAAFSDGLTFPILTKVLRAFPEKE